MKAICLRTNRTGSGRRLFVGLYAASGAAALVYEVAWTRLLTLQMGHTVAATSTVLAAFMGGLAVGAWLAGRLDSAPHAAARLRAYASLELTIAVAALLLPFALRAVVPALAAAYADGGAPVRFAITRVVLSLALLGIPAAAMGATYPIATAWFARAASVADAGVLYAANTAGAALGAIASGFWLIPALGLTMTTWVGVALNALAAGGALWLASRESAPSAILLSDAAPNAVTAAPARAAAGKKRRQAANAGPPTARAPRIAAPPKPWLACTAAAASGCAALVYEVAWTRVIALVVGPTTYAFATMAASFIVGIAVGSAAGSRVARKAARPAVWLALMLAATGVAAAAAAWFAANRLPLAVAEQVAAPDAAFGAIVVRQACTIALLLLPMTTALGAAFPLAIATASTGGATLGRDAARVYASNTLGSIVGALAGGFALVPWLGLRGTVHATAIAGALAGAACLVPALASGERGKRARGVFAGAVVAVVAIAAIAVLPPWDRDLLTSGAYKYAPYIRTGDFESALHAGHLEYYKEGAAGTITVRRLTGTLSLAIDGKVDASNAGDMLTQRLLGLLPVLVQGHPKQVCIIGLGSGVTLDSALATGQVQQADVVEISPEVVEASAFFRRENHHALEAPGVTLIVGDGRSHLLLTSRTYDVIVSEPSNPWMAGVAALFTREFFEAARARLTPDGVLCQWAHTYDISPEDLQSIVHTFGTVFPQGTMWLVGEGDLLLIGTNGAAVLPRLDGIARNLPMGRATATLADAGVRANAAPFSVLSLFAGGPAELAQYGRAARVQTDDRTSLEFSAPRSIYGRVTFENAAAVRALASNAGVPPAVRASADAATDTDWTGRGRMELQAEAYAAAFSAFRTAVSLNPLNSDALAGLSEAAAGARRQDEARAWLESLASTQPANAAVRVELSRLYAAGGDFERAVHTADEAARLSPDDPKPVEQLASVLADAGDVPRLATVAQALARRFPNDPDARYYLASALFLEGKTGDALAEARRIVAAHPDHARAQNLVGAGCATTGQADCARSAFTASIQANPKDPGTYVNLGLLELQIGNRQDAVAAFSEALAIDPTAASARDGLAKARTR